MRAQASMAMAASGTIGQIDEDPVAALDAVALEHIGEAADLAMKLLVGERAFFARLAGGGRFPLPDQRGFVGAWGVQMPVETIVADIELAADEPLGVGLLPFQTFGSSA